MNLSTSTQKTLAAGFNQANYDEMNNTKLITATVQIKINQLQNQNNFNISQKFLP
jgi:hypothetical protein